MDPHDQPYYWLAGTFVNLDKGENTDLAAIEEGYVSITPIHYDLTSYEFLDKLTDWNWEDQESSQSAKSPTRWPTTWRTVIRAAVALTSSPAGSATYR